MSKRTLLWFRRQLRVNDQPLFEAVNISHGQAIGIWILDERELLGSDPNFDDDLGFPRCGNLRLKFLLESVADLRQSLRNLGTDLLIRQGPPEDIIPKVVEELEIIQVALVREPGTEERQIEKRVTQALVAAEQPVKVSSLAPETLLQIDNPEAHV